MSTVGPVIAPVASNVMLPSIVTPGAPEFVKLVGVCIDNCVESVDLMLLSINSVSYTHLTLPTMDHV